MIQLLAAIVLLMCISFSDAHRISCYYRYNHRNVTLGEDVLRHVSCTHIIISFATVSSDLKLDLSAVGERDGLKAMVQRIRSPNRRVMISIGGGGGDANFARMVRTNENTNTFVTALVDLVRESLLDGVDYDWEFPSLLQMDDFSRLLNKTKEVFDHFSAHHPGGNERGLDISVALPGPVTLTAGYDVGVLKRTCTFFNVMTYDLVLYASWRPQAAFHNALYGQGTLFNPLRLFSTRTSMYNWVTLGLPADRLLLGIPTYGIAYQLLDPRRTALFAPVTGYSHLGANVNYDQICRIIRANPQGNNFDAQSRVPYATDGNGTWISYDNVASVVEKVQFAVKHGFGGIMIFSLNADDPFGKCSNDGSESGDPSDSFPLSQVAIATLKDSLRIP